MVKVERRSDKKERRKENEVMIKVRKGIYTFGLNPGKLFAAPSPRPRDRRGDKRAAAHAYSEKPLDRI